MLSCKVCKQTSNLLDEVCYFDIHGHAYNDPMDIERNAQNPDALAHILCHDCAENFDFESTGGIDMNVRRVKKKKVITLCGSTRFKNEFNEINKELTLQGNLVISVGVFGHAEGIQLTEQEKMMLDDIHFQKINMADEIFVINVGGYIGTSTKREIAYAESLGKPVQYLVN